MHITTTEIFADHYQFYIFDESFNHFDEPRLDWNSAERLEFGYLATERAIYVSTVAHLNRHRLKVFLDETPLAQYERTFYTRLRVDGSAIKISAPANAEEDDLEIQVAPGAYNVWVCSRNIGIDELSTDPDSDDQLSEEEFLHREDLEVYDLFIQPVV